MRASFAEGDLNPEPFVIATADTRMVIKPFNTETLEFAEELLERRNDVYDKVVKLTDNVFLNTGGIQMVYEALRDFIIKRAKERYFVDDFEPILREAYNHFKKNGNNTIQKYIDTEFTYVGFIGFFSNGNPGELILNSNGEIFKQDLPPGGFNSRMFPPTQEIRDNADTLMDFTQSPFRHTNSIFELVINHLIYVHALIASQEVDTVSETCLVHILKKVNGKVQYEVMELNLAEKIKEVQNLL